MSNILAIYSKVWFMDHCLASVHGIHFARVFQSFLSCTLWFSTSCLSLYSVFCIMPLTLKQCEYKWWDHMDIKALHFKQIRIPTLDWSTSTNKTRKDWKFKARSSLHTFWLVARPKYVSHYLLPPRVHMRRKLGWKWMQFGYLGPPHPI